MGESEWEWVGMGAEWYRAAQKGTEWYRMVAMVGGSVQRWEARIEFRCWSKCAARGVRRRRCLHTLVPGRRRPRMSGGSSGHK
eukprot:6947138-Prymnesium_polylepis.1